ncbi:sterol desaturase family protein [Aureivirga sp. CE67]|uniref:sterol desaturase family protein n=1 Tax=Aureivirga sp. CE67 TaxID=1788983 RepID=UPI0018CABF65|nr:sterol desaturase family protein [Aureivirga sp. CE67]
MEFTLESYISIFKNSFGNYFNYLVHEISSPSIQNYFYALIGISIAVWLLEIVFPWRKKQGIFRKDFWLDTFYMFFNFFIFNLIIFIALSNTFEHFFKNILDVFGLKVSSLQLFDVDNLPKTLGLFIFFIITDFVQWCTHVLLHKVPFLWNFHKVHHSVKEMGFAAHLRYHWAETFVYKSLLYIPLAIIGGFDAKDVIIVHFITIIIGHLNHANFRLPLGPLKYIFNSAEVHIWHHAKELPKEKKDGINFGISLSIWDVIFKTFHLPHSGKDIEIGFENDEKFPDNFIKQELYPLTKKD